MAILKDEYGVLRKGTVRESSSDCFMSVCKKAKRSLVVVWPPCQICTVAAAPLKMVKRSDGKSRWSWVSMRLPAQQPALRTDVLATLRRCSSMGENDVDLAACAQVSANVIDHGSHEPHGNSVCLKISTNTHARTLASKVFMISVMVTLAPKVTPVPPTAMVRSSSSTDTSMSSVSVGRL
jgi:hypothetical protein